MAHTYGKASTRASASSNPVVSASFTVASDETVLVLLLKVVGGTNRAGGAPSFTGQAMTQANSTQKAASSPECSAELWYLEAPPVGPGTVSIPNTGSATVYYQLATGKSATGQSAFDVAAGNNGTSTNPSPGAAVTTVNGAIGFAVVASGAQTWSPSGRAGTVISDTDDGAHGTGTQYVLQATAGSHTLNWTFGTSDDWGAVSAYFKEVAPTPTINDTASASESQSSAGDATKADTASTTETTSGSTAITVTDNASAGESVSFINGISVTDTATATDSRSISGDITKTDTGSASDGQSLAAASNLTDTGTASDARTLDASASSTDTAASGESNSQAALMSHADTATAADSPSYAENIETIDVSVNDTASSNEGQGFGAGIGVQDTATGNELRTLDATVSRVDTATASESLSSQVVISVTDGASANETRSAAGGTSVNDPSVAADGFLGHVEYAVADTATVNDSNSYIESIPTNIPVPPLTYLLYAGTNSIELTANEREVVFRSGKTKISLNSGERSITLEPCKNFIDLENEP